ncbi:unnamed protein product [Amoebophrya sp. A120]|nr:unnamed protein product [Amoebophrya sp. A120]|eukprot:GSA120T00001449001.1
MNKMMSKNDKTDPAAASAGPNTGPEEGAANGQKQGVQRDGVQILAAKDAPEDGLVPSSCQHTTRVEVATAPVPGTRTTDFDAEHGSNESLVETTRLSSQDEQDALFRKVMTDTGGLYKDLASWLKPSPPETVDDLDKMLESYRRGTANQTQLRQGAPTSSSTSSAATPPTAIHNVRAPPSASSSGSAAGGCAPSANTNTVPPHMIKVPSSTGEVVAVGEGNDLIGSAQKTQSHFSSRALSTQTVTASLSGGKAQIFSETSIVSNESPFAIFPATAAATGGSGLLFSTASSSAGATGAGAASSSQQTTLTSKEPLSSFSCSVLAPDQSSTSGLQLQQPAQSTTRSNPASPAGSSSSCERARNGAIDENEIVMDAAAAEVQAPNNKRFRWKYNSISPDDDEDASVAVAPALAAGTGASSDLQPAQLRVDISSTIMGNQGGSPSQSGRQAQDHGAQKLGNATNIDAKQKKNAYAQNPDVKDEVAADRGEGTIAKKGIDVAPVRLLGLGGEESESQHLDLADKDETKLQMGPAAASLQGVDSKNEEKPGQGAGKKGGADVEVAGEDAESRKKRLAQEREERKKSRKKEKRADMTPAQRAEANELRREKRKKRRDDELATNRAARARKEGGVASVAKDKDNAPGPGNGGDAPQ